MQQFNAFPHDILYKFQQLSGRRKDIIVEKSNVGGKRVVSGDSRSKAMTVIWRRREESLDRMRV